MYIGFDSSRIEEVAITCGCKLLVNVGNVVSIYDLDEIQLFPQGLQLHSVTSSVCSRFPSWIVIFIFLIFILTYL
jgi:hypothetical protein